MELGRELWRRLLQDFSTPCYVFDESCFIQKLKQAKKEAADGKLCFSMKANPFMAKIASEHVDLIEVCSFGELKLCVQKGIPAGQVVVAGINKEKGYLDAACAYGVKHFVVESESQMEKLYASWHRNGRNMIDVALRLSIGNQFGMTLEEAELVCKKYGGKGIDIDGLHIYAGTQNREFNKTRAHFDKFSEALGRLKQIPNMIISRIVYGCGAYVDYFVTDTGTDEEDCFGRVAKEMRASFPEYELEYELGRYLSASCGIYVTKVLERRCNDRTYIITDGGTHQITYYNQMYGRKIPYLVQIPERERKEKCMVCGSLCTSADIMIYDCLLGEMQEGDYIVFKNAGAYTMTEGIQLFLSRELPEVVLLGQSGELVRLREKIDTGKLNGGNGIE